MERTGVELELAAIGLEESLVLRIDGILRRAVSQLSELWLHIYSLTLSRDPHLLQMAGCLYGPQCYASMSCSVYLHAHMGMHAPPCVFACSHVHAYL